jgi:hypothetical protein
LPLNNKIDNPYVHGFHQSGSTSPRVITETLGGLQWGGACRLCFPVLHKAIRINT